ncbi:S9 family peptidase [Leptolyngbya sp. FACHB-321]|uniref:S9 family peptidase n=1 Tax=Leptolyngbya sp. FACHB-321 TaxID=2692807 RepID=UPI001686C84A|nr:S9 family peptidase [Leptolyngbya sp. FACHB-321]MBD2034207.1 S9 family peptidase [Leptolyngbya sp. FACHB-321]
MNQRVVSSTVLPPIADKQPHRLSIHGDDRTDDYFWLRYRDEPNVIAYLEAENDYTKAVMAHTESLQTALYDEMLARIQETDLSVPYRKGDYYYYSRTETGKAYPIYCRKAGSLDAPETVLLDQNALAEGHDFFELGLFDISPNHQLLAYSVDTTGSERYTLFFLDLATGQLYPETILETGYGFAWGNDNQTIFYTLMDEANRPFKLMRHRLSSAASDDELVYSEADESYFLSVGKTRSDAYILLELGSKITSEVHYLDANQPEGKFQVIQPRSSGIEYQVEHHSDSFYIVTNDEALNFKLMQTPVTTPAKDNWQLVIPHRDQVLLEGVSAFAKHLVIYERESGLPTIRVRQLASGEEHFIQFPDPTYSADEGSNPEFDTEILRFNYTSLVTPRSVFDYNLETQERELKKETPVLGGYDRTQYASDRLMATATDGTQVPISIVYKKGLEQNGAKPLLLTGYGSYGFSYPAAFSSTRLSLLERGVVVAIAHIRGGSEMGRQWYEDGKFLKKKNTFTDFIACSEHLIAQGWTSKEQLAVVGGSAGGLLMGAVINLRPDLFKAVVAHVPFVDVVTTILDDHLPLSVMEREEWGDPNDKTFYDYMKSYSPYDRVEAKDYPNLLITAGLNDARVAYWEPAKWTAKLRSLKTDHNCLLLKTNMGAGHGGASGRYESLKEIAFEYAFLFDQWGLV